MPNPAWFNETYYAEQKVAQMNATSYEMGAGKWLATNGGGATQWTVELYNQYLAQYTLPGTQQAVTAYQNFEACNGADYAASITLADVNVSPNQYFNVNEYLQALADYNNANPDAYEGSAPAGGWTVANELSTIFNTYHSSVWNHYDANWDTLQLDPSNAFDTSAYLEARAEAMGNGATVADAIAAIKAAGLNPVQDFFIFGADHNISATPVSTPLTPVLPDGGWTVWGEQDTPPAPEDTDPFEQNVTNVAMTAGQTTYPGEGETYSGNTQFDATWIPSSANSTLSAKDVITGPENTYNTLSVTLGKNWTGFSGVKQEDGTVAPSVTNVGRVELIHNPANSEASWTFDAKNISEDAYRFDLVGADGPGAISLSNLSDAVSEIRISDLQPKDLPGGKTGLAPDATAINFVTGANSGKNDALTLTVENVGANGKAAAITSSNFGIENLTVNALKGDGTSYVDLANLSGVKALNFTGAGDIQVTNVATSVKTFDASEATGTVNMAVSSTSSSTSVKGGSGYDTITLVNATSWTPASIENVEAIATMNGTNNINFAKIESAPDTLHMWDKTVSTTIRNISADNFTVYQHTTSGSVTVNGTKDGSLGNLTYNTNGAETTAMRIVGANIESNATGDVTINVNGKDTYSGQVTLGNAQTLTINANEESESKFTATQLIANTITELTVNASNAFTMGNPSSSLKAVQDVTINLENTKPNGTNDETKINVDMQSAQNVTINADGQDVTLQNLGSSKGTGSVNLDVNEAVDFTVKDISANLGTNINVDIEATGDVKIGNLSNSTNVLAGGEGDIQLTIADATSVAGWNGTGQSAITINGGPMNINLAEVTGDAFSTSNEVTLKSSGDINYTGAAGDDYVILGALGKGSTANIDLGSAGSVGNSLTIDRLANSATVNVTFGDGTDALTLNPATGGTGTVLVNVEGYSATDSDTLAFANASQLANVNAAYELLSKYFSVSEAGTDGLVTSGSKGYYDNGSSTFYAIAQSGDAVTIVAVDDVTAAEASSLLI